MIGDILKMMKEKILSLPLDKWVDVTAILDDNISNKSIQIFLTDDNYQKIVESKDWSGQIKDEKGDFLMVVDSNMASLKTDSVMKKEISYDLSQDKEGVIVNLSINYSHEGGSDWRTSRYRSYMRAYIPSGSKLISANGCNDNVYVGEEYGKGLFGCLVVVEPGSMNHINFKYRLPDRIHKYILNNKEYTLYGQKQAGSRIDELKVNLVFVNKIRANNPNGFNVYRPDPKTFNWSGDFKADKKFIINF